MKKVIYLNIILLCSIGYSFAQNADNYDRYLRLGIAAIQESNTEKAFHYYMKAFSERMPQHPCRIYESAVFAVRLGYIDLAFMLLNLAIDKGFSDLRHIRNNQDFPALNDPRFERALKKLETRDTLLLRLSHRLDTVFYNDQKYRILIGSVDRNTPEWYKLVEQMSRTDSVNLEIVQDIIVRYGFWGNSLRTVESRNAKWVVIQHSPIDVRERFANILRIALDRQEIAPQTFARIEDRNLLYRTGQQKYGTHFRIENDRVIIDDLIDPENVNNERRKVGLPPLEEFIQSIKKMYNLPTARSQSPDS